MTEAVLCVDDEVNVLSAFQRHLRKDFRIETEAGPEAGLTAVQQRGPYAVVVSDLQMPGMNGIQFLAKVREISPDTVRVMLTGQADLDAAVKAVNEGNIFRFLTKPCPPENLAKALQAAQAQYRLVVAEKELLERTLSGSVKVLTEMLSLAYPAAFSRAVRIKNYVRHIASSLQAPNLWEFELAAMLSQIGCITLPPDTLDKLYTRIPLTPEEQRMFASHPAVGRNLLVNIPRLESVAKMIEGQQRSYRDYPRTPAKEPIALGAQMLRIAIDFDQLLASGMTLEAATGALQSRAADYNPEMLTALSTAELPHFQKERRLARVSELTAQMIVDEDVRAKSGLLLLGKGQEVTYPVLERLKRFSLTMGIVEPIHVLVPASGQVLQEHTV